MKNLERMQRRARELLRTAEEFYDDARPILKRAATVPGIDPDLPDLYEDIDIIIDEIVDSLSVLNGQLDDAIAGPYIDDIDFGNY